MNIAPNLLLSKFLKSSHSNILVWGPMPLDTLGHKLFEQTSTKHSHLFIDGGIIHKDLVPKYSHRLHLGDADSSPITPDILLSKQKDYTDLDFALASLNSEEFETISFLGFQGGELDHYLAALKGIYELSAKSNARIRMDHCCFLQKNTEHPLHLHGDFSLLSFEKTHVCLRGDLDYECDKELSAFSGEGIDNVAHGDFSLKASKTIILFNKSSNVL